MFRIFIISSFVSLLMLSSAARGAQRPNFLFLYADDHRHDALSCVQKEQGERGRFPWFQTPNLDRLAAEGTRFRNAFVTCSLCAPSRAVFLTGRYNHENGVASNFRPFPTDNVTHATLLRRVGYTTGYLGKWHMDSQRERPGFDFHASYIAHSTYVNPTFIVNGVDTKREGWIDDLSTDYAIEFFKRQKESREPWSLVVGFKSPHGPFTPPERAAKRFEGEVARAVPNLGSPAPYSQRSRERAKTVDLAAKTAPASLAYFRCISGIDDCVGRLLAALDELGLAENTVVVYTSDNGYYLGEHALGDKRSAYDESLRIPFLVRYPKLGDAARGKTNDEMVLNLDLAPTLLDLAGVPIPKQMQGRSWRPLLEGRGGPWRKSWFYEYFAERQNNSDVPDITAVRTSSAKLIRYPGHDDWTELFDLAADPYETSNLARSPEHLELRKKLQAEHERLVKEVGYRVPDYVDRPDWWNRGSPGALPQIVLDFNFAKDKDERVLDASGQENHGQAHDAPLVEGREGRPARRFDGKSHIAVPKSRSLSPAGVPITIDVVVKPGGGGGVLVARGGKTTGYALHLAGGKPAFTLTRNGTSHGVSGADEVTGRWVRLTGSVAADSTMQLYVDGKLAAKEKVSGLLDRDPVEGLEIGVDLGTKVVPEATAFRGEIERVRIHRGEAPP